MAGRKLNPKLKAELEKREGKHGSKEPYSSVGKPGKILTRDPTRSAVSAAEYDSLTRQGQALMNSGSTFEQAIEIFGLKNQPPPLPMNPGGTVGRLTREMITNELIDRDDLPAGLQFMIDLGGMVGRPSWLQ